MTDVVPLAVLFFLVALLYGSVGHAGASGYLGVMALVGVDPDGMKPTALLVNVLVASISTLNFRRAGVFYPQQALPLIAGSIPFAFLGGTVDPSASWYRPLVAVVLALAAVRSLLPRRAGGAIDDHPPRIPWLPALGVGAAIGFVSGLTGTGGGIFLTPIVVGLGWANIRQSAGLSALFILVNSVAGLLGSVTSSTVWNPHTPALAAAAGLGGFAGSWLGANRLPERPLSIVLGVILMGAAVKLVFG